MTIKQLQIKSFSGPGGLQGSQSNTRKFDKTRGGLQDNKRTQTAFDVRQQLMEAQKSKDTLSCQDCYNGSSQFENEKLYPKAQHHSTGASIYSNSSKNLNNSNQKTAKINFRGLLNSNSVNTAAKAITETKAWKFAQNKNVKWFVNEAATNQAVFEALNALVITCILRPAAILAQNNDSNREKNKKAASHSISSGIIGYGFAVALFTPIANGLKKIKNNPEIYAKKAMNFFQKNGNKKVSMQASKRFATYTMLCTYGPQLFTAAVRSAITIAMIPFIDKYLLNHIFGTHKKPGAKEERPTMDPMYNYYYLNFTSSQKAKKAFQNFTGVVK